MSAAFVHRPGAHCESGVMSTLLAHYGMPLSEAMAFGLASALSFAWLPFIKLGGLPLVAYRMPPKAIIRGLQKPLGMRMRFETFGSPAQGMARLDALLDAQRVVGLQTSVYWLPYFPPDLRFHFNAHNAVVYGREQDHYLISDPVFEHTVRCSAQDLQNARFAKGVLAPKGLIYYPQKPASEPHWPRAIAAAVGKTTRIMLHTPLPFVGVRGIHRMARALRKAPAQGSPQSVRLLMGHIVRMQEEIGTGGAGFRFLYAAFLQEAAERTACAALAELGAELIDIGDQWRAFALLAARMVRQREPLCVRQPADALDALAQRERTFFRSLRKAL